MELKQTEPDHQHSRPETSKKHKPKHQPTGSHNHHKTHEKSLRDDWERTLKNKNHDQTDHQLGAEVEIDLHANITRTPKAEVVNKDDPVWEPWQEKTTALESHTSEIEQPTYQEEIIAEPITLDPNLSDEARRHAEAVDTITRTHAETSTPFSYKDSLQKEAQEIIERLQPAPNNHIEQSVWHNIEVDNTGKAVEHPNFDYGEAYQSEIRTESDSFQTEDPGTVAAASGQLAVSSPTLNSDVQANSVSNEESPPDRYTVPMDRYDQMPSGRTNVEPVLMVILIVVIIAIILAIAI